MCVCLCLMLNVACVCVSHAFWVCGHMYEICDKLLSRLRARASRQLMAECSLVCACAYGCGCVRIDAFSEFRFRVFMLAWVLRQR